MLFIKRLLSYFLTPRPKFKLRNVVKVTSFPGTLYGLIIAVEKDEHGYWYTVKTGFCEQKLKRHESELELTKRTTY